MRKNIIYLIADQMRWDVLPCNGADFIKAPNFDYLAENGVNFSCTYSGNPVCVPARGILATGCYSHICMSPEALNFNGGSILPAYTHIAQHLRSNGYAAYGVGKFHCLPYNTNPGFDIFELAEEGRIELMKNQGKLSEDIKEDYLEYLRAEGLYGMQRAHGIGNNDIRAGQSPLSEEYYVDTWATTRGLEILREHMNAQNNKPFFLQIGFVKPHAPFDPPAPYDKMYNPQEIPEAWGSLEDLKNRNPLMSTFRPNYLIDRMSDATFQYSRAHYFGLISYLDTQLGRILNFLKVNKLLEDTIIVYTADHGENLGDHGLFFKTFFTEGSTRIPFLIFDPCSDVKGISYDKPVGQEDIMPTICNLAGIKIPDNVDGVSLSVVMKNSTCKHKPFVISQHGSKQGLMLMLRNERYKYCFCRYESTEELYDMENDPHELNNLAAGNSFKNILVNMRKTLNQWCKLNNHEQILNMDGSLSYSIFNLKDHLSSPRDAMGIRPW